MPHEDVVNFSRLERHIPVPRPASTLGCLHPVEGLWLGNQAV